MLKRATALVTLGAAAMCVLPGNVEAHGSRDRILVPIGGGYETVGDFTRVAARQAAGRSVDFDVLPTAYAESMDEAIENGDYDLALERTADVETACNAIVDHAKFPEGCKATLVDLWSEEDGSAPDVLASLRDPKLDALYFLGGDQGAAMNVIAGSKAEAAMKAAYERGLVVGGTSAGNAIQSKTMSNGYTDYGDASVGLDIGAIDMWYGDADAPLERGLSFGSRTSVFDQHLYERGRFGRLLNEVAQTADRFGRGGLLGIGADTDSAPVIKNDRTITEIFGPTSVTVVDFKTLGTKYAWLDESGKPVKNASPEDTPTASLAAQNVLTHVLAPKSKKGKSEISYDLEDRTATFQGREARLPRWSHFSCDQLRASKTVILGGDLSVGPEWPTDSGVLREFLSRAKPGGAILIATAAYDSEEGASADVASYTEALALSGFTGEIKTKAYPDTFSPSELANAGGIIFLGGNQLNLPDVLANSAYASFVATAAERAPITFYEHAFAAAAGDVYDAIDDAADWIEAYKADQAVVKKGLGLVASGAAVAFEPRVQWDYRYGRFFGIPMAAKKRPIVFGISEGSAIVVGPRGGRIVGETPVFQTDSTWATFYTGDNGAIGALNVVVDAYEPEQRLHPYSHRRSGGWGWWRRDRSDNPKRRQR